MSKKVGKFALRAVISVALMAAIISRMDLAALQGTFSSVDLGLFSLAMLLFLVQQAAIAYSWQILLDARSGGVGFGTVLRVHFMGTFFGVFMPTSIGMDIVRAFSLSRRMQRGVDAATSIFVSRVVGYVVFFAIALLVAVPVAYQTGKSLLFWLVLALFAAFMVAVWLSLSSRVLALFAPLLRRVRLGGVVAKIEAFQQGAQLLHRDHGLMARLVAISLAYQVLGIVVIFLVGRSLGLAIDVQYYFIYVPLIMAITILPLSIAGIGVREGAFVFFFVPLGATQEQALSLSLLLFAQMIFVAVIGGVLYFWGGFDRGTAAAESAEVTAGQPERVEP